MTNQFAHEQHLFVLPYAGLDNPLDLGRLLRRICNPGPGPLVRPYLVMGTGWGSLFY